MRSLVRILPPRGDYPRLAIWIFFIAWLIGGVALKIGLNGLEGERPGICLFVIACVTWWVAYRLGGRKSRAGIVVGFLAISVWTLSLGGSIVFLFHDYITDFFFWASTVTLSLLIMAVALSEAPPDRATKS